ncbi:MULTISPECIES: hypothetical protein [Rhizobium]|nr:MULTISPECIES: hypothetical protein [Rhizobium]EGE57743.1 hypothetical protein RHECNPAF_405006 [Rhizobium etli CNPAF512]MBB4332406.1 hypothetical protein [Rhizobium leguminosarum]MBB4357391.1 hypothetical protein [Rhizobium leguminosarum]MBB4510181.1 hypothetical protein [Rhizobium leguminosarum]MBB4552046.1 hypothetical protein [Rhizobium leguminosarum]
MAHEETADLLRSARLKILQNSIFHQDKRTEIEFAKISGESYPFRGWPPKQAVVYTSDIKREWFGAIEGDNKPWPPGPSTGGYWPHTPRTLRPHVDQHNTLARSRLRQAVSTSITFLLIGEVAAAPHCRLQTVLQSRVKLFTRASNE